jgi:phytanoyl-CoA dioxygenase PhyH
MTTEAAARTRLRQSLRREWRFTWRYAYNLPAVIEYRRTHPVLTPGAARMAEDLVAHGVAVGSVDDIMPTDTELFDRVGQAACDLLHDRAVAEEARKKNGGTTTTKSYVLELLGRNPTFDPESPIIQLAMHEQLRGLIEQYVHMHLRLHDLNVWLNLPSGDAPQLSQRWHRDEPDDRHILKAFIYLRDVPDGAGPLAYVRGSHREAVRKAQLPATWDGYGHRVEDDVIEQNFGAEQVISIPGPAGTIVVTDTRGYHRGGWAVDQERLVMMALYASRTSRKRRLIRPGPGIDPAEWSGEVAFLDHPD